MLRRATSVVHVISTAHPFLTPHTRYHYSLQYNERAYTQDIENPKVSHYYHAMTCTVRPCVCSPTTEFAEADHRLSQITFFAADSPRNVTSPSIVSNFLSICLLSHTCGHPTAQCNMVYGKHAHQHAKSFSQEKPSQTRKIRRSPSKRGRTIIQTAQPTKQDYFPATSVATHIPSTRDGIQPPTSVH